MCIRDSIDPAFNPASKGYQERLRAYDATRSPAALAAELGAGASIYGATKAAGANEAATAAQSAATQKALDFETQKYGDLTARVAPWVAGGQSATQRMTQLLADPSFGAAPPPYQSQPFAEGPFTAPTAVTAQNDPGYQFRLDQGNQALQRSAAANGTLLSGGTQKALARYNQDYASGEFQNVYNRANQTFQNRYGQYLGENARTLSDYLTNLTAKRTSDTDYWTRLAGLGSAGLAAAQVGQNA